MAWLVRYLGRWFVYRLMRWAGPLVLAWLAKRYGSSAARRPRVPRR